MKNRKRAIKRCNQLIVMVNELLELSRFQDREIKESIEPIDISRLVSDVVDIVRLAAENKGIDLIINIPSSLPEIDGNREGLMKSIECLLDNAVRYTP